MDGCNTRIKTKKTNQEKDGFNYYIEENLDGLSLKLPYSYQANEDVDFYYTQDANTINLNNKL